MVQALYPGLGADPGGTGDTTSLISISIYKQAFDNFNFGSAAAMSVIVFLICYLLGII